MAIISNLLSVAQPLGMWESIIWAFEGFTNNYIWAVVLLTIIIRLIWSPLDTYNRRITAKNAAVQAKMQPELQKIQAKYGNDKQTLNQKTQELYKKYNFNVMGSCGFMLVFMVLNLVVFFTLFGGLNNIASYKIYKNYENLKENYANTLYLADQNYQQFKDLSQEEKEYQFRLFVDGDKQMIGLFDSQQEQSTMDTAVLKGEYKTLEDLAKLDLEVAEGEEAQVNDVIVEIINKFDAEVLVEDNSETTENEKVTLLNKLVSSAMPLIAQQYDATKESFAWIKNIWIADSPFKNSVFEYGDFAGLVRANNLEKNEDKVFASFMPQLQKEKGEVNGYFILTILIIAVSFFSTWLSQALLGKKDKGAKKQGKVMQIIMPLIMGVFAIFYNAVFAIYMLTSQLISTLLLPLQQLIVKKIEQASEKKQLQKQESITDYRRKS